MFWLAQQACECEWRTRAVCRLFRSARNANTPEMRGVRLLRSWLSPAQLAQFDSLGYFDVIGGESGKKYRIRFGICANIVEFAADGTPAMGWCLVPEGRLVAGDVMLAQKVALEGCEQVALAKANRFGAPRR